MEEATTVLGEATIAVGVAVLMLVALVATALVVALGAKTVAEVEHHEDEVPLRRSALEQQFTKSVRQPELAHSCW